MEIHIGDRVADVTLVSKEGNKVQIHFPEKNELSCRLIAISFYLCKGNTFQN